MGDGLPGFSGGIAVEILPAVAGDVGLIVGLGKFPWRRRKQPIAVFLPGESHGRGNLVGCHLWGHTELDTTEAT